MGSCTGMEGIAVKAQIPGAGKAQVPLMFHE
jgi:hypothetical protein